MLSIGDLAARTGEPVKTLRYWTDLGLLDNERGDNGYRYFLPDMAERVHFIRSSQALGFRLSEIKSIVRRRDLGEKPCREVWIDLHQHLAAVRARIEEPQSLETDLARRLEWAEANPDPECEGEGCVYLEPSN